MSREMEAVAANRDLPALGEHGSQGGPAMFGEMMSVADFEKATADATRRNEILDTFIRSVMQEGRHFGPPFPGSEKKTLLKGGAELLDRVFGLMPRPFIDERSIEAWERTPQPFFHIIFRIDMVHRASGLIVGHGFGSCNSHEPKYRYRDGSRKCPNCQKETIFKGKGQDGGWFCWAKKGGCGKQFKTDDQAITGQVIGKVLNEDVASLHNTILKMALKRARMDGTLSTTGVSGFFDADDDDDPPEEGGAGEGGEKKGDATKGDGAKIEDVGGEARQQLAQAVKGAGHKDADVKKWIQETHGFDYTKMGFPKAKFAEILKRLGDPAPLFPVQEAAKEETKAAPAADAPKTQRGMGF